MKVRRHSGIIMLLILALCVSALGTSETQAASKPARPSFKVSKRAKTTATLKIKKKGKVAGYQVYVATSKKGKYRWAAVSRSRTIKLLKLKKGKAYYVKVRAYKIRGYRIIKGKFSKVIKISKYKKKTKSKTNTTQTPPSTNQPSTTNTDQYAKKVLELVNAERAKEGLDALALDETLCKAAVVRAKELTTLFSHTRPDGSSCFSILTEYQYSYGAVGENIAAGAATPEATVEMWMNSEGHRANIMSENYKKMGLGYCSKSGTEYTHYWAQLFSD